MKNVLFRSLTAMLALLCCQTAAAHNLGESYIFLDVYDDGIEGRAEMTVEDVNLALGTNFVDHETVMSEVEPIIETLRAYLTDNIMFAADDVPITLRWVDTELKDPGVAQYISSHFVMEPAPARPDKVEASYTVLFEKDSSRTNIVVVENDWKNGTINQEAHMVASFSPSRPIDTFSVEAGSWFQGMRAIIPLGIEHIWDGIDHIMFVFALLLPAVTRRLPSGDRVGVESFTRALIEVAKVVTVFTIAHSITLTVAALDFIRMPSRLVESVIVFSIAVAAFDIIKPIFKNGILWVVFGFGLFHGFGFASAMQEIGISKGFLVSSVLGFNIGVELGQLAIVIVAFPFLYLLSRWWVYNRVLINIAAALLMAVSLYWFVERAFNVDLPAGAIVNSIIGREA